ncbi:hypothetical protein L596_003412 [Steinernema carpocapsae]|uniref:Aquaporin n=1 Tax=Steinernema carpocapsae TaxID=34508 RepID=A0A4U8UU35_STECR|nr:hypothetical protein L596_003412 [Steinernema carpocapsae]
MNESDHFVLDTHLDPRCGIYDSYPSERPDYYDQCGPSAPLRGILRNPLNRPNFGNGSPHAVGHENIGDRKCHAADAIIRACTAELISVIITVFISLHTESALTEHHLSFLQRIALLSLIDASLVLVFISAFKTVHMSPVISLAQLFAMTTSWFLCILLCLTEVIASIAAVFLYSLLKTVPSTSLATVNQDVKTDWLRAIYILVILQFCGATMVVMSNLMITSRQGGKHVYVGVMTGSPLCLFASILISSFLSLTKSTVRWNPLQSLAISVFFTYTSEHTPWSSHAFFWMGALGGSMFACFLYRLFFAPEDKRLTNCCCTPTSPQPV